MAKKDNQMRVTDGEKVLLTFMRDYNISSELIFQIITDANESKYDSIVVREIMKEFAKLRENVYI